MVKILIICTNCGHGFSSPIPFDSKEEFEISDLSDKITICPECGRFVPCNKENMEIEE